jgi:hypothetical protein
MSASLPNLLDKTLGQRDAEYFRRGRERRQARDAALYRIAGSRSDSDYIRRSEVWAIVRAVVDATLPDAIVEALAEERRRIKEELPEAVQFLVEAALAQRNGRVYK